MTSYRIQFADQFIEHGMEARFYNSELILSTISKQFGVVRISIFHLILGYVCDASGYPYLRYQSY